MTPPGTFTPTPTSAPERFFISKNVFTSDSPVQIQVSISQVPGHYDLTIYNSAGEHIKTMDSMYLDSAFSKTYSWDGTNSFGNKCASGVYVIYLTEPVKRLLGRVVLIH
jgi:flagellar hook assembly protein FlgD